MSHASRIRYALGLAMLAAIVMLAEGIFAAGEADPNSAPNPYRVDEGWAKLPQGRKWGAAIGVDIDRDGKSVWVFDRCGTADDCSGSDLAPIQKFDASGKPVTSFGAGCSIIRTVSSWIGTTTSGCATEEPRTAKAKQ